MAQAELVALAEGPLCDAVYQRLLMPAFPPDELLTLAAIRDGLRTGLLEGLVALDAAGRPLGVTIGEWSPAARVMLLSYLAVAAETRGTGIGSLLLTTQLDRWRETLRPCLVLAEVERPDAHSGDAHRGDPQARLAGDPVLAPAFASLSERDREALALVAWEGLDSRDAARVVGCSTATFAVRLTRARARLRVALEDAGPPAALPVAPPAAPPVAITTATRKAR